MDSMKHKLFACLIGLAFALGVAGQVKAVPLYVPEPVGDCPPLCDLAPNTDDLFALGIPHTEITFDEFGNLQGDPVEEQWDVYGVHFSGGWTWDNATNGQLISPAVGFAGGDLMAFVGPLAMLEIYFDNPITDFAVAGTDTAVKWKVESFLGGVPVDEFEVVIPNADGIGFIGFISSDPFDKVEFTPLTFAALSIDTLQFNTVSVPEPSTMLLFGFGLAGLGFFRRRTKAA